VQTLSGPTYVYRDNMPVVQKTYRPEYVLKKKSNSIFYHAVRDGVCCHGRVNDWACMCSMCLLWTILLIFTPRLCQVGSDKRNQFIRLQLLHGLCDWMVCLIISSSWKRFDVVLGISLLQGQLHTSSDGVECVCVLCSPVNLLLSQNNNIRVRGRRKSARRRACALERAWYCFRYKDIDHTIMK
jgi:hypothetical protein